MQVRSVSVVVPVYNSRATLYDLVARISAALAPVTHSCFEIVLVNDGSRDASWSEIATLASENPHVRGVDLMRNFGQHNAVLAGVRAARCEVIVTLDDDLQHPPEAIPALVAALDDDSPCDLVYGAPIQLRHSRFRNVSTTSSKALLERLAGWPGASSVSDFRAFRARLRDDFADYEAPTVVFDALLAWTTTSVKQVPYEHAPRAVGESNYNLSSLVGYAIEMATAFSVRPLRMIAAVGALCLGAGIVAGGTVIASEIIAARHIVTAAFVLTVMLALAGAQLLALGVVGEYVGRSQLRLLDKPTYLIRRTTSDRCASHQPR